LRETTAVKDFCARPECPEVERRVFEQLACSAVCSEIHLKAAIEPKSINYVCANATTYGIGCLKDGPVDAAFLQRVCARKTGKTSANDRSA